MRKNTTARPVPVSRSFIRLENGPRAYRFWLDEEALERGAVHAPDGTGEQCVACGYDLAEASVVANASATKVVCGGCGEVYTVEVAS